MTRSTFGSAYDPARNNFDVLRFGLAAAVLWSHSYSLAGTLDPLRRLGDQLEGGRLGVEGFFVISGFLVMQSWHRSTTTVAFVVKRVLRLFPALIVALLVSALVIGPFATRRPLGEYLAWSRPWLIFPGVFVHRFLTIPGVFPDNTFFEGADRHQPSAVALAHRKQPGRGEDAHDFGRHGDFSYGLYLYAYPVQQLVLHVGAGHVDPLLVFGLSFPSTLALAALSWRWVEAPALALKPANPRRSARSLSESSVPIRDRFSPAPRSDPAA